MKPDPDYWMDRLNHLRVKANLAPHRNAEGLGSHSHMMMMDNKAMDENLSLNAMNAQKVSVIRRDVSIVFCIFAKCIMCSNKMHFTP